MNGIALTVLMISQLPKFFGFSGEGEGPLRRIWAFAQALLAGKTNGAALMIGTGTLAVILLLKGNKRVPGILVAVVGATVIVGALDLQQRAQGVPVLGLHSRRALPAFAIPWRSHPLCRYRPGLDRWLHLSPSFRLPTPVSVLSRTYARAGPEPMIDPNQEMVGLGALSQLGHRILSGLPRQQQLVRAPPWPKCRRCQNPVGRSGSAHYRLRCC